MQVSLQALYIMLIKEEILSLLILINQQIRLTLHHLVTPSNKPADTNKPAGQAPEITSDLSGKASTPADVTVKATAGSTVKLYNNDGVVIGEAVANDQGVATITPTNSLPEGEITATSTPAGGSESAKSAPITVTKTPILIENAKKTEGLISCK